MAGNSRRRGAVRRSGKGPSVGTGGHNRRRLEGKGPTPRAEDRTGHPAQRRARQAEARAERDPAARAPGSGRARGRTGSEYVAGRNAVVEALEAGVPATAIYVQAGLPADERVRTSLTLANDRGLPVLEATRPDLDRLTAAAVHQGLALQVPAYDYAHPMDLLGAAGDAPALVAALDRVTDPRNLGAVVRSVAAFGGQGVVVPARRSAGVTAGAWKASAGALVRVPVAQAANLTRALQDYRRAGVLVVGLDAGGDVEVGDVGRRFVTDRTPVCLVVGAEGEGLSRLVRETCDVVASIPMAAGNESLNASVAAGIALYHLRR
ncbi:MAG: 23S rRNA (guanosine(2251)-2'-O)-methyltransferase RlmB [Kineosporiaceae bacterium]